MLAYPSFFTEMVDDIVQKAQDDPELADAIKWLDEQARQKGVSFYDIIFEVLHEHEIKEKARKWMRDRNE